MNGDGAVVLSLTDCRDENHILILQSDVGRFTRHYAFYVKAYHFQRTVTVHTVHYGTSSESFFCQSL